MQNVEAGILRPEALRRLIDGVVLIIQPRA
jgi:hypothetical protein